MVFGAFGVGDFISLDFIEKPSASTFLSIDVNENAKFFLFHKLHELVLLLAAITFFRIEDVTGKAFTVDTNDDIISSFDATVSFH